MIKILTNEKYLSLVLLILAVIIRIFLLWYTYDNPLYFPDEKEYVTIAENINMGKGFTFNGDPTSLRPPLYPFFLAIANFIFGSNVIFWSRIFQTLLNLLTAVLIFQIARQILNKRVATLACLLYLFYPSLIGYNVTLLSETLFIFLMTLSAYLFLCYLSQNRIINLILSGAVFGCTALTRDVVYYFVFLLAIYLLFYLKTSYQKRLQQVVLFVLSFLLIITPWIIRNTIVQREFTLISTVGGLTIYWLNNENTPLYEPRSVWEKQKINEKKYYYDYIFEDLNLKSEAAKQKLAMKLTFEYMVNHPVITLQRCIYRAFDFLGQERLVPSQILNNWYGFLNPVLIGILILLIFAFYSTVAIGSIFGLIFSKASSLKIFVSGWVVFNLVIHALVLGHPRYHLALIPFLVIYCALAFINVKSIWQQKHTRKFKFALATTGLLVAIWIFGLTVFDADKILSIIKN